MDTGATRRLWSAALGLEPGHAFGEKAVLASTLTALIDLTHRNRGLAIYCQASFWRNLGQCCRQFPATPVARMKASRSPIANRPCKKEIAGVGWWIRCRLRFRHSWTYWSTFLASCAVTQSPYPPYAPHSNECLWTRSLYQVHN